MAKEELIEMQGIVNEILPDLRCRVTLENGQALENSLGALRAYYDLGVRYMTLTHNTNTSWADSVAVPPEHDGVSRLILEQHDAAAHEREAVHEDAPRGVIEFVGES